MCGASLFGVRNVVVHYGGKKHKARLVDEQVHNLKMQNKKLNVSFHLDLGGGGGGGSKLEKGKNKNSPLNGLS